MVSASHVRRFFLSCFSSAVPITSRRGVPPPRPQSETRPGGIEAAARSSPAVRRSGGDEPSRRLVLGEMSAAPDAPATPSPVPSYHDDVDVTKYDEMLAEKVEALRAKSRASASNSRDDETTDDETTETTGSHSTSSFSPKHRSRCRFRARRKKQKSGWPFRCAGRLWRASSRAFVPPAEDGTTTGAIAEFPMALESINQTMPRLWTPSPTTPPANSPTGWKRRLRAGRAACTSRWCTRGRSTRTGSGAPRRRRARAPPARDRSACADATDRLRGRSLRRRRRYGVQPARPKQRRVGADWRREPRVERLRPRRTRVGVPPARGRVRAERVRR